MPSQSAGVVRLVGGLATRTEARQPSQRQSERHEQVPLGVERQMSLRPRIHRCVLALRVRPEQVDQAVDRRRTYEVELDLDTDRGELLSDLRVGLADQVRLLGLDLGVGRKDAGLLGCEVVEDRVLEVSVRIDQLEQIVRVRTREQLVALELDLAVMVREQESRSILIDVRDRARDLW